MSDAPLVVFHVIERGGIARLPRDPPSIRLVPLLELLVDAGDAVDAPPLDPLERLLIPTGSAAAAGLLRPRVGSLPLDVSLGVKVLLLLLIAGLDEKSASRTACSETARCCFAAFRRSANLTALRESA